MREQEMCSFFLGLTWPQPNEASYNITLVQGRLQAEVDIPRTSFPDLA